VTLSEQLANARAQLAAIDAELLRAATKPEQYNIIGTGHSGRTTVNRSLNDLINARKYWESVVVRYERGGIRVRRGVPVA
jgi:hypothetical protein